MVIRLELPGLPPTLNRVRRMHWAARYREETRIRSDWWIAYVDQGRPGYRSWLRRVRVGMTFRLPARRRRDRDGYIGGPGKLLLDFLVGNCGMVIDDSEEHVELREVGFERGEEGVVVEVEEL